MNLFQLFLQIQRIAASHNLIQLFPAINYNKFNQKCLIQSLLILRFNHLMSALQSQTQQQNPEIPQTNQVTVYFRLPDSKSIKLQQPITQSVSQLKLQVQQIMKIAYEDLVIYMKGKELIDGNSVTLYQKAILHIKNFKVGCEEITVNIVKHLPQKLNLFKFNYEFEPVKVKLDSNIRQFLIDYILDHGNVFDLRRSKIIQSGRFVNYKKSFKEQKIANSSQIHIILRNVISKPQDKDQQYHQTFIQTVLKHSKQNSLVGRQSKLDQNNSVLEQEKEGIAQLQGQIITPRLSIDSDHFSSCHNKTHHQDSSRLSLSLSRLRDQNFNFLNHTKSSMMSTSQKVIKEKLTPLKFGLHHKKKFQGPKSQRQCDCKQRKLREKLQRAQSRDAIIHEQIPVQPVQKRRKLLRGMTMKF